MKTESECLSLILQAPRRYKKCIFYLRSTQNGEAVPINPNDKCTIDIKGRSRCATACNEDVVVVDSWTFMENGKQCHRGRVIWVQTSDLWKKKTKLACTIDWKANMMRPLCQTVPKVEIAHKHVYKEHKESINNVVGIYKIKKCGYLLFTKCIRVNLKNKDDKIFIVRLLHWDEHYVYPYGVVVDVVNVKCTPESSLNVLNLKYRLPIPYKKSNKYETQCSSKDAAYTDNTDIFCFTIDPENSTDLDDALSVEKLDNGHFRVGVHIADVSVVVPKDSDLDKEAYKRGVTYYQPKCINQAPNYMLPNSVTRASSLLPNQRRRTISVFFLFDEEHRRLHGTEVLFQQSMIKSKAQLTYEEAQRIISTGKSSHQSRTIDAVKILHQISLQLREARSKCGEQFYCSINDTDDFESLEAHMLIEEFMLLANRYVAEYLTRHYTGRGEPLIVPLRVQDPPKDEDLKAWQVKHGADAALSFRCKKYSGSVRDHPPVRIIAKVWAEMNKYFDGPNIKQRKLVEKLICCDDMHPTFAVMLHKWYNIQQNSSYSSASSVCQRNGSPRTGQATHFSLDFKYYTQFTSPLRRYIDLVVHRLLLAAIRNEEPPYSEKEMERICCHINKVSKINKDYQKHCKILEFSERLQEQPVSYLASIDKMEADSGISLCIPFSKIPARNVTVKFGDLSLSKQPDLDNDMPTITFQGRIYDTNPLQHNRYLRTPHFVKEHTTRKLDSEALVVKIRDNWSSLQGVIRRGCFGTREGDVAFQKAKEEVDLWIKSKKGFVLDVTSEMSLTPLGRQQHKLVQHLVQFEKKLCMANVMQIQIGVKLEKGLLSPYIQAVNITKTIDICMDHKTDPIRAFARIATKSCLPVKYKSIASYQDVWLPIIDMDAAVTANQQPVESVIVRDVSITWYKKGKMYFGSFELLDSFLSERQISLYPTGKEEDFKGMSMDELIERFKNDYHHFLCIQYRCEEEKPGKGLWKLFQFPYFKWIAHCLTIAVIKRSQKMTPGRSEHSGKFGETAVIKVIFKVHHSNLLEYPEKFVGLDKPAVCSSLEVISVPEPQKHMRNTVCALPRSTKLAVTIALNKKFPKLHYDPVSSIQSIELLSHLPHSNKNQAEAVWKALKHPFSLIQGPPGTGKTLTGVRLVYWFVEMNNENWKPGMPHKRLLYCGPSNKAVDVVATFIKEKLKFYGPPRLNICPKIVRVYSQTIETSEFPIPGKPSLKGKHDSYANKDHHDIALHHLIRTIDSPFQKRILQIDRVFANTIRTSGEADDELIREYRNIVEKAEKFILEFAEVILCTCTAAGSDRIYVPNTQVEQCIVDECGMCTEPESLIPIVKSKAKQVVLIGDHKQLKPVILCKPAEELGMGRSIFERYSENDEVFTMLTTQYRMHPSICQFPSEQFYDGTLGPAWTEEWCSPSKFPFQQFYDGKLRAPLTKESKPNMLTGEWCSRSRLTGRYKQSLEGFWPGREYRGYRGSDQVTAFHHIEGVEETLTVSTDEGHEKSKSNQAEVERVVEIYRKLIMQYDVQPREIMVLSQYKLQRTKLEASLKELLLKIYPQKIRQIYRKEMFEEKERMKEADRDMSMSDEELKKKMMSIRGYDRPCVSTVVFSQGDEKDFVILSTVRSLPRDDIDEKPTKGWKNQFLGFIQDKNQINVAITRAMRGMIIVGNRNLLSCDEMWRELLRHYYHRGCIIDGTTKKQAYHNDARPGR